MSWWPTLVREARLRAGIVLDGNVRDLFWCDRNRRYLTLGRLLAELPGFDARVTSDGHRVRCFDDESARLWLANESDTLGLGGSRGEGTERQLEQPLADSLARFEELRAESRAPLLVLDWAHLLVTHPSHLPTDERDWLRGVGQLLVGRDERVVDSDTLRARGGLIVLLVPSLGALPVSLYQGEPRVKVVTVPTPDRDARRDFFRRHVDDLRVAEPREAAPREGAPEPARRAPPDRIVEALADHTDRLTTVDLQQVLTLSTTTAAPLSPDALMSLYRHGDHVSPWEQLSLGKLEALSNALGARVIGQPRAVEHVATTVLRAWLGLAGLQHSARRDKPKGILFFVGPTGVGKTELAKALAEQLFGDESACVRFDMSEYNHEHSDQRLVGAPPGYVGFEAGGQLTNAVRERPFSVLLFDEVEKAHGRVLDKFLQILEDGRLTDGRGETAYFNESVLVFTSNLGASAAPATSTGEEQRLHYEDAVRRHFVEALGRPELLNRLGDNVVVFERLDAPEVRRAILERKLAPITRHLRDRFGVDLRLDAEALAHLLATARPEHGGRAFVNAIERELVNPMARFLFAHFTQLVRGRALLAYGVERAIAFELSEGRS